MNSFQDTLHSPHPSRISIYLVWSGRHITPQPGRHSSPLDIAPVARAPAASDHADLAATPSRSTGSTRSSHGTARPTSISPPIERTTHPPLRPAPPAAHAPAPPAAHAPAAAAAPAAAVGDLLARLVLGLGRVVDEQRVERQAVGQDEVADRAAANVHRVERDRVLAPGRHLDVAQRRVHLRRDRGDGAVDDGACCPSSSLSRPR
ncbi:uncharacterized protein E0L32_004342 [Thyridium curvatum]|uniref:Uncharacterized protein n=1 Tax=Thyridium curvatum TaxID=1093900 RepID=A0A507BAM1_9PEZI|nr:uncharacterized protein E0L32_004342 [Thyridium curvatum]TPX15644.1 hypothetical protein E0L32_004342 [Thyridium curvatum]